MAAAACFAAPAFATGPSEPGTTGTPAPIISARAAALLPMRLITSAPGPMNTRPQRATRRANSAFSDKKP